jgi:putative salt-induced outer membrane protein
MTTPTLAALTTLVAHLAGVHLGSARVAEPAAPEEPAVPAGAVEATPATSGSTEIAGQGQFAAAAAALEAESSDATELELATGGVLSSGNAFAAAITGQGRFRVRREIHQGAVQVVGNYGRADVPRLDDNGVVLGKERDTTVSNLQGQARYDAFFAKHWSAFGMATLRRDRFQGLDLRLNVDPGIAFHVLAEARHRLSIEAGYDFQYDIRRDEAIADKTQVNHAARLFVGYNNSVSDRITLDTGLEYLQSFLVARRFRVNWVSALGIQLAGRVGLAVTFTLRYEHQPLPEVQPLDTITAILLTVRFM